jgi:hypothetical protein
MMTRSSNRSLLVSCAVLSAAACTVRDPLFCDPTHPCAPGLYCDLTGDYDPQHIRNSCVPSPFDAAPSADAAPMTAMLSINMSTYDFHDVVMGTSSLPGQLVVKNDGDLAAGPIAVSIAGTNESSFSIIPTGDSSDCQGQQLAGHATCIVQVEYHAGGPGSESATLHVDATPGGSPLVALTGNSLAQGALEVIAGDPLVFGSQAIQSSSSAQTITIHNKGGVPCSNLTFAFQDPSDYAKVSTTCATNLAAGASCDYLVQFTPATVGVHDSALTISSDQGAIAPQLQGTGTSSVTVNSSGTGTVSDTLSTSIISGCSGTCSGTYSTTPITLHANTSGGIPFDGWTGACVTAGKNLDCTLALTQPTYSVGATFGVCAPGAGMCTSGMLTTCDATGHWAMTPTTCALGCYTDNTRCWDVDPLNGLASELDATPTAPVVVLSDGASIDTNAGTVLDGNSNLVTVPSAVVSQASGYPSIRVFEVKSLHLLGKTTVTGTNALAIVSDGDIEIDGELHLAPTLMSSGGYSVTDPGSMSCDTTNGSGGFPSSSTRPGGGGGGGFEIAGARGGNNPPTTGGAGGVVASSTTLMPLRGGCEGAPSTLLGVAGTGGGAVELVSRTTINVVGGAVNVSGGGGYGRLPGALGPQDGGNGGGAGGGVVLEAPSVVLTGSSAALAANGGAGSADCSAGKGQDGQPSGAPAVGGTCTGDATRTNGGTGAALQLSIAGHGIDLSTGADTSQPGGGGGGMGVIRIDTVSATTGYAPGAGTTISGLLSRNAVGRR